MCIYRQSPVKNQPINHKVDNFYVYEVAMQHSLSKIGQRRERKTEKVKILSAL